MEMHITPITLTLQCAKDPKVGGYMGWFAEAPNILAEGGTRKELLENLLNALTTISRSEKNGNLILANILTAQGQSIAKAAFNKTAFNAVLNGYLSKYQSWHDKSRNPISDEIFTQIINDLKDLIETKKQLGL